MGRQGEIRSSKEGGKLKRRNCISGTTRFKMEKSKRKYFKNGYP